MPEQPGLLAEQLFAIDDMIGHLVRRQVDQRLPADRAQRHAEAVEGPADLVGRGRGAGAVDHHPPGLLDMAVGEMDLALALDDEAELAEIDALDPLDVFRIVPVEIIGLDVREQRAFRLAEFDLRPRIAVIFGGRLGRFHPGCAPHLYPVDPRLFPSRIPYFLRQIYRAVTE